MNLHDFLYTYLNKVKDNGGDFILAACPVHKNGQERNPSFSVNSKTGSYHCFSCGIKGSFRKLQQLVNANPADLVDFEAANDPYVVKKAQEPEGNDNIDESVLSLYRHCPVDLLDAGFTEATLFEHEVGYDPLYERVTFPIRNLEGRLIAISGRAQDGIDPRYKVYTTPMLRGAADDNYGGSNKGVLYCGHKIGYARNVIVVEGYKACLWLRQAGYTNTVATMGTMVTPRQQVELRKICDRAIILFDMDTSGREASKKLQSELLKSGLPATVIQYSTTTKSEPSPDDLSPDELDALIGHYKPAATAA